jgi:hypothetical protein
MCLHCPFFMRITRFVCATLHQALSVSWVVRVHTETELESPSEVSEEGEMTMFKHVDLTPWLHPGYPLVKSQNGAISFKH